MNFISNEQSHGKNRHRNGKFHLLLKQNFGFYILVKAH